MVVGTKLGPGHYPSQSDRAYAYRDYGVLHIDSGELRRVALNHLRASLSDALPFATLAIALIYGLLVPAHASFLPLGIAAPMMVTAALIAVILGAMRIALERVTLLREQPDVSALIIAGLASLHAFLLMALRGEPLDTITVMLLLLAGGFFFASKAALVTLIALTNVTWAVIVSLQPPSPLSTHFGFNLIMADILSGLFYYYRFRTALRTQRLYLTHMTQQEYIARAYRDSEFARRSLRETEEQLVQEATRREQVEVDREETEQEFRRIIERMHDIYYRVDLDGTLVRVSPSVRRYGYQPDELLRDQSWKIPLGGSVLADGQALHAGRDEEVILRSKYGSVICFSNTFWPVFDRSGNNVAIEGVLRDITERKERERELHVARAAAEAANQAKSEFLATMSHEIRTPMHAIVSMVDLLSRSSLSTDQRECVDIAKNASGNLLELIDDILDLARIEAGKVELETSVFDLRSLLSTTFGMFEEGGRSKGLELRLEVSDAVPTAVTGDAGRLRGVLTNLLGNALKFTNTGRVVLRALLAERSDQAVVVRFEIEDTGIGLSEEQRKRIFEPFVQADASTTRRYGGSGLGLAISRRLVELMRGEIGVHSTEGQGSTFWFTVPLQLAAQEVLTAEKAESAADILPEKLDGEVLVVEDNPINQRVTSKLLEEIGCRAHIVGSGFEAIEVLRYKDFKAILMDCQMPDMDGFETTTRIRRQENEIGRHTPIIAMTANALKGDRERCLAAGMDDYVPKPVELETLRRSLAFWFKAGTAGVRTAAPVSGPKLPATARSEEEAKGVEAQTVPVLDLKAAIARAGNDPVLLAELVDLFFTDTAEMIAVLERGLRERDASAVTRAAHTIKSDAGVLGAQRLYDAALQVERIGREEALDKIDSAVRTLRRELSAAQDELTATYRRKAAQAG